MRVGKSASFLPQLLVSSALRVSRHLTFYFPIIFTEIPLKSLFLEADYIVALNNI